MGPCCETMNCSIIESGKPDVSWGGAQTTLAQFRNHNPPCEPLAAEHPSRLAKCLRHMCMQSGGDSSPPPVMFCLMGIIRKIKFHCGKIWTPKKRPHQANTICIGNSSYCAHLVARMSGRRSDVRLGGGSRPGGQVFRSTRILAKLGGGANKKNGTRRQIKCVLSL